LYDISQFLSHVCKVNSVYRLQSHGQTLENQNQLIPIPQFRQENLNEKNALKNLQEKRPLCRFIK